MRALLCAALVGATMLAPSAARADELSPLALAPRPGNRALVVPTAMIQVDAQGHPQEEEGPNGFSVARMRIGAWSNPTPYLFGLVQAEFADPEHPVPLDALVRFGPWRGLRVSVGYNRTPLFVSARTELEGTNPLPELSLPVRALWPGRDTGVELHYTPDLPLEGWFRVSNGSPSPFTNDNGSLAFTGRIDATAGRSRWNATGHEPWGLRVGVGAVFDDTFDRAGAPGRIATGFTFYRPPTVAGLRRVVEGHALAYAGPVRALLEVGSAVESREADTDGNPATPRVNLEPSLTRGGALEVAWMVTGERRIASTWPIWGRKNPFAFDHPAVELALRGERVDLGRGARDVPTGGATAGALSGNVWLNELTALTLAGYLYAYDRAPIEELDRLSSWILMARMTLFLNPSPVGSPRFGS